MCLRLNSQCCKIRKERTRLIRVGANSTVSHVKIFLNCGIQDVLCFLWAPVPAKMGICVRAGPGHTSPHFPPQKFPATPLHHRIRENDVVTGANGNRQFRISPYISLHLAKGCSETPCGWKAEFEGTKAFPTSQLFSRSCCTANSLFLRVFPGLQVTHQSEFCSLSP